MRLPSKKLRKTMRKTTKKSIKKSTRKTKNRIRRMSNRMKKFTKRNKKIRGGSYAEDITTAEYEGFPYKNENSVVVTYPGGVMDLKDYKGLMEDEDREGYDPLA